MTGHTVNYAGRQLDMELLQHVEVPHTQYVVPSVDKDGDGSGPRICAGMEKVVQRYAKLLLTEMGSVKFDESVGGDLARILRTGTISSEEYFKFAFDVSSRNALDVMISDDNDRYYGEPVPDERIVSAELVSMEVDTATASAKLHVRIETLAGTDYKFIVPVASGIS